MAEFAVTKVSRSSFAVLKLLGGAVTLYTYKPPLPRHPLSHRLPHQR